MSVRQPVFDAVKALVPGVWTEPGNILAMDNLLDAFGVPRGEGTARRMGPAGLRLVKEFEGCHLTAYRCPAGIWTIGWGATGPGIAKGLVWSQQECDLRLEADLAKFAAEVEAAIGKTPTTQAQFDALVSFHYNTGAIGKATLTRKHNAHDYAGAAAEFDKWVMAGGKKLPGLVRRRAAERALYES